MESLKAGTARLLAGGDQATGSIWRWIFSFAVLCGGIVFIHFLNRIPAVRHFLGWVLFDLLPYAPNDPQSLELVYSSFTFIFIAVQIIPILIALRIVGLTASKTVAPSGRARWGLAISVAIAISLILIFVGLIGIWLDGERRDLQLAAISDAVWVRLPVVLFAITFQAAAEELLFRGYLLQTIGRWLKSWWALLLVVSALFCAPHLVNAEFDLSEWLTYLHYVLVSLVFTGLALATGRLEYSIGAHIGLNWSTMIIEVSSTPSPEAALGDFLYLRLWDPSLIDAAYVVFLNGFMLVFCLWLHFRHVETRRV
ncbi:CPBP family intramembrane glutamic endopeptidase [Pelagibius sp. Alg239-R121]|uniref:CPBP family intramembrane glutamic endopeptidase n=1 Tax=Pelagibius sp. Alg239-R121 TaxID=2993448 RepID=UPI0024A6B373|nr:CPBP family intramembrane glutamic endopeptidase [Pelagibius sp. Alg239-R121]